MEVFLRKGLIQTVPIAQGGDGRWRYPRIQLELVEIGSRGYLREEERQGGYSDQDQKAMAKSPANVTHGGMLSQIERATQSRDVDVRSSASRTDATSQLFLGCPISFAAASTL
jgi:hypothetical protein